MLPSELLRQHRTHPSKRTGTPRTAPKADPERYALIADYLFGEMDAEQRLAFERRVESDPELRAAVEPLVRALHAPRPRKRMSASEVEGHWREFARDNGMTPTTAEAEAEELLRETIERMRRAATGPEHAATRPRKPTPMTWTPPGEGRGSGR